MKFENWTIDELFERCIDTEDGSVFMNSDEVAALRRKIAELRSAQPVSSGYTFNSPEIPDGWKLVPVEPTAEMINAALASGALSIRTAYREMLAAAPGES
ncbi:TPA: hypothetical protein ACNH3R_003713 [Serratia marcescens]